MHHGGEEEIEIPATTSTTSTSAGGELQAFMRFIMESNRQAEADRRAERIAAEKRQEEREELRAEAEIARRREDAKIAEDRRREDAKIIEDRRREEAKIETDRRRAEATALEERERQKEEAANLAAERIRAQKIEDEQRAHVQQQNLMKLQAEIGERAEEARRVDSERSRRRDRAVAAIQNYRDSDDIEDYLVTSEKKLQVGEIPEKEWVSILASKLGGKVGSAWQDLLMTEGSYEDVKAGMLKICGYTPKLAGEVFFGFRQDALKGMSADQLWHRGVQLLRRIVAPAKLESGVEFALVKAWIWSIVPRRTRILLDSRVVTSPGELIGALQDHLVMEGERSEGQVAVFRRQNHGSEHSAGYSSSEKKSVGSCFKCGKTGHKAADCWQKDTSGGSSGASKPSSSGSGSVRTIVCYTCGIEGHKSTQCPKIKQENPSPEEGQAKPVRRLRHKGGTDVVIKGVVNGKEVSIVLDSGTVISVVPEDMVGEELKTGEVVSIIAFQSKEPVYLPVARVKFKVEHLEWEEEVALAPVIEGQNAEVLCRFDIRCDRGWQLAALVRKYDEVLREVTRSESKEEASEQKENDEVIATEKLEVKEVVAEKAKKKPAAAAGSEAVGTGKGVLAVDRPVSTSEPGPAAAMEASTDGLGKMAEDRPAKDPRSEEEDFDPSLAEDEGCAIELLAEDEGCAVDLLAEDEAEDVSLAEEEEDLIGDELFCLKPKGSKENDLVISPVKSEKGSRADLVEELKTDPSLERWRTLAEGDLVLSRMSDIKEAWQGPYNIVKAVSRVEYEVKLEKGGSKVVHIDNLKKYYPRMEEDRRIMVVENWKEDKVLEPNSGKSRDDSERRKIGFDRSIVGLDRRKIGFDRSIDGFDRSIDGVDRSIVGSDRRKVGFDRSIDGFD